MIAAVEVIRGYYLSGPMTVRDGVYRRLEYPQSACDGWGDGQACEAQGRTVLARPARWLRDGHLYCGTCKRADEAWRAGGVVSVAGLDPEIRTALVDRLAPDGLSCRVRHEVWLRAAVEVRIDLLAVTGADPTTGVGGMVEAFEIKSDADSVTRLPKQILGYDQAAQRCWLAVGSRHHAKAAALLPDHWGVLVHDAAGLHLDRPATDNPNLNPIIAMNLVVGRSTLTDLARRAGRSHRPASAMYVHELREHIGTAGPRDWVMGEIARNVAPPTHPKARLTSTNMVESAHGNAHTDAPGARLW